MDWSWLQGIALVALNNLVLLFWKPWAGAYAGEKGKNLARKEDLNEILAEVKAVAVAQKETEAAFLKADWNYRNLWTHRMQAYSSLMSGIYEIRDRLFRVHHATWDLDSGKDPKFVQEFEAAMKECTSQLSKLNQLASAAILVGDEEIALVVDAMRGALSIALRPDPRHLEEGIRMLDNHLLSFMNAAKKHLELPLLDRTSKDFSQSARRG